MIIEGRGGRGGRGGAGKNRHMGEIESIRGLLNGPGMTDADILEVINPPASQRDRSVYLGTIGTPQYQENAIMMPGHAEFRYSVSVGRQLDPRSQVVRANHFRIDADRMVERIVHYHVHIYGYSKGELQKEDQAPDIDERKSIELLRNLIRAHPEWEVHGGTRQPVGLTYDGRSALFSTQPIDMPLIDTDGAPFLMEDVHLLDPDGNPSNSRYRVVLTMLGDIIPPQGNWNNCEQNVLRALDTCLLSFAKWEASSDNPEWFIKSKSSNIYRSSSDKFPLAPGYVAQRGYYAGLKTCMAGLVLVSDMSVSSFLSGGEMVNVLFQVAGFRSVDDLRKECERSGGLSSRVISNLTEVLKKVKCKNYRGHTKEIRALGPPANSEDSSFDVEIERNGERVRTRMTVQRYFEYLARERRDPFVLSKLGRDGRLQYPSLPTIDVGTKKRPMLFPAELINVRCGQAQKKSKMTGEATAQIIKYAAVRPDERMQHITENSIVTVMRENKDARAFGVGDIAPEPMQCNAILLPPAKIRYGGGRDVDPQLSGSWNMERQKFAHPPPAPIERKYMYGILLVGDRPPQGDYKSIVRRFVEDLERDAESAGVSLKSGGAPMVANPSERDEIKHKLSQMKVHGVRIVIVLLVSDHYSEVKLESDKLGVPTQCLRWKNIEKPPRGYHQNVMLKINTKMGGTNHTLIPRGRPSATPVFQDPPQSLSWLFDKPCMLVGIDVSHADPGVEKESLAAVVASMDGRAYQYATHISSQTCRGEMVEVLTDAMVKLLDLFRRRNGAMPSNIIIYRDGVSDGQFDQVLKFEMPMIKDALALLGYMDNDKVKIAIVICQKGHHTRVVYEESSGANPSYINPCAGLLIDATGGKNSIASGRHNEFYLNSHAAIQGTSKPCKYSLIFDEIGFKMAELELLTYWTCYLYCRCNKSVSMASPVYYAHWAARRARNLFAAGATSVDLKAISKIWTEEQDNNTMYFI